MLFPYRQPSGFGFLWRGFSLVPLLPSLGQYYAHLTRHLWAPVQYDDDGEKGRCWDVALELLAECKPWSTPNVFSYSATISACEKGCQ